MKILFETHVGTTDRRRYCSGVKKGGLRLVQGQGLEELNQIMMNQSYSADAEGQQRDDDNGGPSGSGSSHQKSLCCKSYGFSKGADDDVGDEVHHSKKIKRSMWLGLTYDSSLSNPTAAAFQFLLLILLYIFLGFDVLLFVRLLVLNFLTLLCYFLFCFVPCFVLGANLNFCQVEVVSNKTCKG